MLISLDFDDTWTAAPAMWAEVCKVVRKHGHSVICVTARHATDAAEVKAEIGAHVDEIVYTGGMLKEPFCEALGIPISIWIDDMPEIIKESRLIGA